MGPPKPSPGRAETKPDKPAPVPGAHRAANRRGPRLRVRGPGPASRAPVAHAPATQGPATQGLAKPGLAKRGLTKLRGLTARLPVTLAETQPPAVDPARAARRAEAAGLGLARLTVLPALAVAAWLVPGLPLLAAGVFAPVPMLLISAPLLAGLAVNVLHRVPARWPTGLPAAAGDRPLAGWLTIAATVVVAVGFLAWQLALNSPSLLATRTPGVSFQAGYWIAQHGSLPIPGSLSAFGGSHPGLRLSSIGFVQHGQSVVPAVTAGLPMLLAAGFWTSGTGGGAVIAPVLGALAVLSFGGLAGRLAGRRWAPAGALVLALTLPEIYTSRNAFSEPAVQILLFGGLSLVIDALTSARNEMPAAGAGARAGVDLRKHGRPEPAGHSRSATGPQPAASGKAGPGSAGPFSAAPGGAGPASAGPGGAGPGTAGPGTAGPGSAGEVGSGGPGDEDLHGPAGAGDLTDAATETAPLPLIGESVISGPAPDDRVPNDRVPGGPAAAGPPGTFLGGVDARSRIAQDRVSGFAPRSLAALREFRWREAAVRAVSGVTPVPALAALGGLCLGLTSLLSLTSFVYLVPVIAIAAVLVVARRLCGVAFCGGILIGTGYGAWAGFVLAQPPAGTQAAPLRVLSLDAAGLFVVAIAVTALLRAPGIRKRVRGALGRLPLRWLPGVTSAAVVAGIGWLAVRPYVQIERGTLSPGAARFVGLAQRLAGLRVDPSRLYSEDTLYWVIWYAGVATVLLGAFGAVILARRCVRALLSWDDPGGAALNWALPLAVILGGSAAVLWQPFTVPDQPWASRRLVPVVLPGLILLAIWSAAWLTRKARDRAAGAATIVIVGAFCVGAMLLPSVSTAFGLGLTHTGSRGGLQPTAGGLAQHRVGAHESSAVRSLCASIGRSSSVLILDARVAAVFSQTIRGMCGVPVARLAPGAAPSVVGAVVSGISRAGRHAVLLGSSPAQVGGFGGRPTVVLNLTTTQYPHVLTQPPGAPWRARYRIWMAMIAQGTSGI